MIYVASDFHGFPLELIIELFRKADFGSNDYCFILGDVIDRGDDGIKILRWIMQQPNVELIMGNHEAMMLTNREIIETMSENRDRRSILLKLPKFQNWVSNGAMPTFNAMMLLRDSEQKYIFEYLEKCSLYVTLKLDGKEFILTHSGLGRFSPDKPLERYTSYELLWYRPDLLERFYPDKTLIFGHTPTLFYGDKYAGRIMKNDTWIDIDAGAAFDFAPALLRLDDMKEFYLE